MNRRRYVRTLGTVIGGAGTLAGCLGAPEGEEGTPTSTETDTPEGTPTQEESTTTGAETTDGAGGDTTTVSMITDGDQYYFDPIGLFVEQGATVTWTNESGSHSSTAYQEGNGPAGTTRIPEGAEPWDSGILSESGATFEHTFETTGTYDYFCVPHKTLGMVGRIVVGEPGGPAEGSMPPDGDVPESSTIVEQGSVSYQQFSG